MILLIRDTLATHQEYGGSQNVAITPPAVISEHMFRPVVTGHKNLGRVTLVNKLDEFVDTLHIVGRIQHAPRYYQRLLLFKPILLKINLTTNSVEGV